MSHLFSMRKLAISLAMFAFIALGSAMVARADTVFVLSGADFSGPTANTGGNITISISDIAGGVRISIANNLVDPTAFVDEIYLNTTFAPLNGPSGVCVSCAAIGGVNGNPYSGWQFGTDAFKADGDGKYDLKLEMPNAAGPGRLDIGETVVFDITATNLGFNAASFLTLSLPDGGNGPFQVAAHIQSLPGGGSDFITTPVPEPASLLLLGTGLVGIAAGLRRRLHS